MLYIVKLLNLKLHIPISSVLLLHSPSGICLPGTELLQSSFKTEFTMGHFRCDIDDPGGVIADFCGVLADPCGVIPDPCSVVMIHEVIGGRAVVDAATPVIARLAKHHKTLSNIVKHHETLVKHCDTS